MTRRGMLIVTGAAVAIVGVAIYAGLLATERLPGQNGGTVGRSIGQPSEGQVMLDARHGGDLVVATRDGQVAACDGASDGNPVKAVVEYGHADRRSSGTVADRDGSNNTCVAIKVDGEVLRLRACEHGRFTWDCDNWQAADPNAG